MYFEQESLRVYSLFHVAISFPLCVTVTSVGNVVSLFWVGYLVFAAQLLAVNFFSAGSGWVLNISLCFRVNLALYVASSVPSSLQIN